MLDSLFLHVSVVAAFYGAQICLNSLLWLVGPCPACGDEEHEEKGGGGCWGVCEDLRTWMSTSSPVKKHVWALSLKGG